MQSGLERLEDPLLRDVRREDDRHIRKRRHLLLELRAVRVHGVLVLLDEVPLVDHDHHTTIAVEDVPENVLVLLLESLGRVHQQQAHVTLVNRLHRPNRAVEFQVVVHLLPLPQPGRVHDLKVETERIEARVHTVPGRPGDVRHNVPLLTKQGVDEGTFAHVGPSHDGELGQSQILPFLLRRQLLHERVQQVPCTIPVVGADAEELIANAQSVELRRGILLRPRVNLVDHKHHRLSCPPHQLRNVLVQIGDASLRIHHEDNQGCLLHAGLHLLPNHAFKDIIRPGRVSPCINDGEHTTSPQRLAVFPIPRRSCRRISDGIARLGQPVEQRGLPHVGPADDGHEIVHVVLMNGAPERPANLSKKKGPPKGPQGGVDILSRSSSTICAGRLNFSVRNGKRWTLPQ